MINSVSIVIPIFNESATVLELLEKVAAVALPTGLRKELILVESNSTDGTREKVIAFCQKAKENSAYDIKLILQDRPIGKGAAVREGLTQAHGDILLIQDADLEYDVADYPILLQPIIDGHTDFVLGSRHLSAGHWKIRKFEKSWSKALFMNLGGSFFHWLFNRVYRTTLTDPTTMYKVFLAECIRGVKFEANRFDFDWELVAKLVRLGYIPLEVPVSYNSRGFESGKKINIWRDPFTYIVAIFKFRIKRITRVTRAERLQTRMTTGTMI